MLNRNTKKQSKGVILIEADRHMLGDSLKEYDFDVIIDTAYHANDVETLLDAVGNYKDYVLISSSAVYPEYEIQPFTEETPIAVNKFWGKYGTDKTEAEKTREAFVFDCALADRKFYLPKDGEMKLQFFHIHDLCRFIDVLIREKPEHHIFNVGNKDTISIRKWVELCYNIVGKSVEFVNVFTHRREFLSRRASSH